jgi:hypothetical protein
MPTLQESLKKISVARAIAFLPNFVTFVNTDSKQGFD